MQLTGVFQAVPRGQKVLQAKGHHDTATKVSENNLHDSVGWRPFSYSNIVARLINKCRPCRRRGLSTIRTCKERFFFALLAQTLILCGAGHGVRCSDRPSRYHKSSQLAQRAHTSRWLRCSRLTMHSRRYLAPPLKCSIFQVNTRRISRRRLLGCQRPPSPRTTNLRWQSVEAPSLRLSATDGQPKHTDSALFCLPAGGSRPDCSHSGHRFQQVACLLRGRTVGPARNRRPIILTLQCVEAAWPWTMPTAITLHVRRSATPKQTLCMPHSFPLAAVRFAADSSRADLPHQLRHRHPT